MELYFLDSSFVGQYVVDNFKSLIWTKRYYTCGDFELYVPATKDTLDMVRSCLYVGRDDDDSVMIIEKIRITTSVEDGDYFIITGRSLESILTRRIVWNQTVISTDDAAEAIYQILEDNIINPEDTSRTISNFVIDDSFTTAEPLSTQITGTELMSAIETICRKFGLGFKMSINSSGQIVFGLYQGSAVDTTFSEEYDNLISSDYSYDDSQLKTVALVAGEGEGTGRKQTTVFSDSSATGIDRRELYVDARDISSNNGEIPDADYLDLLATRGSDRLTNEQDIVSGFEGEVEPNMTYEYRIDYNLGDVVTVSNSYGITSNPRIVEIIECWDDTGYKIIPTFETWEV